MGRPRVNFTCKIEGCNRKAVGRQLCGTHHRKWCEENPDEVQPMARNGATVMERVQAHAYRDGEHLIWTGGTYHGVPRMGLPRSDEDRGPTHTVNVRSAIWRATGGTVTQGYIVSAGVMCPRGCVEPAHLRLTRPRSSDYRTVDTAWEDYELLRDLCAANGTLEAVAIRRSVTRQLIDQHRKRMMNRRTNIEGGSLAAVLGYAKAFRARLDEL